MNYLKPPRKRTRIYKKAATSVHVISSDVINKPNLKVMTSKKIWEMVQQLPEGSELKPFKSTELVALAR